MFHFNWFPVTFGETDVSGRIKHAITFQKPKKYLTALCIVLCIVLAVCFATNRKANGKEPLPLEGTWTETADWDEYGAGSAKTGYYKEISMGNIKITLTSPKTSIPLREVSGSSENDVTGIEVGMQIEYTGPEASILLIGSSEENETPVFAAEFQNPFHNGSYRNSFLSEETTLPLKLDNKISPVYPVLYSDELDYGILSWSGDYAVTFTADFSVADEQGTVLEGPYSYTLTLPFEIVDEKKYVWTWEELPNAVPDDFDLYATVATLSLDTKNAKIGNGYREENFTTIKLTSKDKEKLYRILLANDIFSLFREDYQPFYNSQIFAMPWFVNTLSVTCGGKTAVLTYRVTDSWASDGTPEQEKLGKLSSEIAQFIYSRKEYATIEEYIEILD